MKLYMRMVKRHYWIDRIEKAWSRRPILWLSGVRRAGKTSLSQTLENIEYFDCELPRVRRMMEDPEDFLKSLGKKRVVLDEIHRLQNPSELLKIAADHFKDIRILATGSSTLQASSKFRDTLTGRKEEIWLTPMNQSDLKDFKDTDLKRRLQRGGLPPFFQTSGRESDYQEWMDSYWAKDIQELFRLERRSSFQKFLELLFVNTGGLFEATSYTGPCEISRTTVTNYLNVLEATRVAQIIRPFSTSGKTEIISAPKVYTFDTGFIAYYKGWDSIRPSDLGILWEHYIFNELFSRISSDRIHYWRDKQKHELDIVLTKRGSTSSEPTAIECKWKADAFDPQALKSFRQRYPHGENWVIASDVDRPYQRTMDGLLVKYRSIEGLIAEIS